MRDIYDTRLLAAIILHDMTRDLKPLSYEREGYAREALARARTLYQTITKEQMFPGEKG